MSIYMNQLSKCTAQDEFEVARSAYCSAFSLVESTHVQQSTVYPADLSLSSALRLSIESYHELSAYAVLEVQLKQTVLQLIAQSA